MEFAFVFPGQGSQSLKMMDGLLADYPKVKNTFNQAKKILGVDFLKMLQEETTDSINQTENTQPLMLTAGVATYQVYLEEGGKKPTILAGHSLGEWAALVASGVIAFSDALKLVKLRALAMQEAVPEGEGGMAAILGLDDETVIKICSQIEKETKKVVAPVNFNSVGQVVIAGNKDAVDKASLVLKESGAKKVQVLAVSVPSHCSLMQNASKKVASAIASIEFKTPQIPVIHNCDASSYTDPALIKEALIKQLYSPVLWTSIIKKIFDSNISHIVECGPGKVLSGLNKRIDNNIVSYNLHKRDDLQKILTELN